MRWRLLRTFYYFRQMIRVNHKSMELPGANKDDSRFEVSWLELGHQIFHYACCIALKRVTSWRVPSPRRSARATQLLSKKCRNDDELLATVCPIWPVRDLNLEPFAPETNAFRPYQLAGDIDFSAYD